MHNQRTLRTAAEVWVDQLAINGVRHAFCVPGESYLAVPDALCAWAISMQKFTWQQGYGQ